jgi:hypothetical protein
MKLNQTLRQFALLTTISLAVVAGTNAAQTAKLTTAIGGTGRGTFSPNYNGKALNINQTYTIKAVAAAGSEFSNWIVVGTNTTTNTSAKLTFQMVSNLQLTANFSDIKPPTVAITTKKGTGSNSVVTIIGTAKDNVGVASVWCQAGSSGWNLAVTSDGYTNWTAVVILGAGANIIQAYAEDAAGNRSLTNSVSLTDDSTGLAPESIAGTTLQLVATSNEGAVLSFGASTFSQAGSGGASTGAGNYTYTLSDANTAQLADALTAQPMTGSNSDVFTLSFTNGTSGTWSNLDTNSGTFTLSDASSAAPDSLSGLTLQGADAGSNSYQFTNEYGDGILTTMDTSGTSSSTYTFMQFSPAAGMVQAISTNGTTNYVLLNFAAGSNTYYAVSIDATNGMETNAGTFSVTGEPSAAGYTAPVSLDGLTGAVTMVKTDGQRKSFEISFDASTFGQFSSNTNQDSGVGTYTYARTGAKTALFLNTYLAPPNAVANEGETAPNPFFFTSSHSGNFTNADGHGTITFSEKAVTVPLSLVGRKLTGNNGGHAGGFSFGYGTFSGLGGDSGETGNYTYAIYGPQVAMAILNPTDPNDAGSLSYLELWFSSATGGNFNQSDSSGKIHTGSFSMK